VTVTVEAELPVEAVIGEVEDTRELPRLTAAGSTVTIALSVTPTAPFTVAVIVFDSAAVELTVPVI